MTVANASSRNEHAPRISCIVCAYDEAPRIAAVLKVAAAHPMLAELIVVDDGSTDNTAEVVRQFPSVRLIERATNGGKSLAIADGIAAAQCEFLMLLDADLKGLSPDNLSALAAPVLSGRAEVSMSLRQNSLLIFRALGIDFVSGERVVRKTLLETVLADIQRLPRFGIEVFMNRRIIERRLRIAVIHWPHVTQARKTEKLGYWQGVRAEWRMITDLLKAIYPLALISQTLRLLSLRITEGRAPFAARMSRASTTPR
ncbi:glycosyltransferase family 2 protein [Paraburkholderia sp. PREW-6R]|uniref:glycosyltransferase family 2 protein n=1 Tax=Paraburkholderia sp. PREW-6R TaxID=3141544 RepID=UPI0031F4F72D